MELINLPTNQDSRGALSVIEATSDVFPFKIERIFYIYGVSDSEERGNHANRKSNFLMVALNGSVEVELDDGTNAKKFVLDDPSRGLLAPKMTWKKMSNFSSDAVLMVVASEKYDAAEYIKDYQEFIKEVAK